MAIQSMTSLIFPNEMGCLYYVGREASVAQRPACRRSRKMVAPFPMSQPTPIISLSLSSRVLFSSRECGGDEAQAVERFVWAWLCTGSSCCRFSVCSYVCQSVSAPVLVPVCVILRFQYCFSVPSPIPACLSCLFSPHLFPFEFPFLLAFPVFCSPLHLLQFNSI